MMMKINLQKRKIMKFTYRIKSVASVIAVLTAMLTVLSSCRGDEFISLSEDEDTGGTPVVSNIIGMYVLNEGNMGSNKCTLDFLDLSANNTTVHYIRNIYSERNPTEVKELGDVGNDIQVYGSRLWMVINVSNKVEVADAYTCKKIGQVNIANCRYVVFHENYAYVSSYAGPVELGGRAQLGRVYKVDTLTLQKVDSVTVGYQPEQMGIVDGKLYVANSGGYRANRKYDNTVSQIDLATFKEERKIEVSMNLHRCDADKYGQLWVTSRGNYSSDDPVPSRLHWLQKDRNGEMQRTDSLDITVSDMCIVGDSLYYIGVDNTNTSTNGTITYGIVNVRTHQVISTSLSDSEEISSIRMPYSIIVNPLHKDFYIMDARDFVTSGKLFHFTADGKYDWDVSTGDIPAQAAFLHERENDENE